MTRQTYSTDSFLAEVESWDERSSTKECFPATSNCPFEKEESEPTLVCSLCPFAEENRQHFINQLKMIKVLELDNVPVSEITKAVEKRG